MTTRWGLGTTLGPGGCEAPRALSSRAQSGIDDEVRASWHMCRRRRRRHHGALPNMDGSQVRELLHAAQSRAAATLRRSRDDLYALARALFERDTLSKVSARDLYACMHAGVT